MISVFFQQKMILLQFWKYSLQLYKARCLTLALVDPFDQINNLLLTLFIILFSNMRVIF